MARKIDVRFHELRQIVFMNTVKIGNDVWNETRTELQNGEGTKMMNGWLTLELWTNYNTCYVQ
jgi:uncharacterized membrane protein